ncbi:hypothetical protein [Pleurocapsa sp. PCC 7319]|uniref:hypothetical protein n=1 Tax=Pleurocapsa sp. PCC 7319 TaxID=118161 RepID=UPI0003470EF3|nr:hypothetical protein [Pleurocapsa sp. PCC 7319]
MRCIQPYISQFGKFGQQIQRSHYIYGNSLSQKIASKYGGFQLGKFSSLVLSWLRQRNSETIVCNLIQILNNQLVNLFPVANLLKIDFNLFGHSLTGSTAIANNYLGDNLVTKIQLFINTKSIQTLVNNFLQQSRNVSPRKINIQPVNRSESSNFLILPQHKSVSSPKIPRRSLTNFIVPKQNSESIQFDSIVSSNFGDRPINTAISDSIKEVIDDNNRDQNETSDFSLVVTKTKTSKLIEAVTIKWNVSEFKSKFGLSRKSDFNPTLKPLATEEKIAFSFSHNLPLESASKQTKRFKQLSSNTENFKQQVDRTVVKTNSETYYKDTLFSSKLKRELVNTNFKNSGYKSISQSPSFLVSPSLVYSHNRQKQDNFPVTTTPQIGQEKRPKSWKQSKSTNFDPSSIDVNNLADRVFQVIERKLKIERQRRGIL